MISGNDIKKHLILNELFGVAEGATASTRHTIANNGTPVTDRDIVDFVSGLQAVDTGTEIQAAVNISYAFNWKVQHTFQDGLEVGTAGTNGVVGLNSGGNVVYLTNIGNALALTSDSGSPSLNLGDSGQTSDQSIHFITDLGTAVLRWDYGNARFEMDDDLFINSLQAVVQPVVSTSAVSGWADGDFYGQQKIHSDGGSPPTHQLFTWLSGPSGDGWVWTAENNV